MLNVPPNILQYKSKLDRLFNCNKFSHYSRQANELAERLRDLSFQHLISLHARLTIPAVSFVPAGYVLIESEELSEIKLECDKNSTISFTYHHPPQKSILPSF